MENVGILNASGKLTKEAKRAIIERLNEAQEKGTEKTPPVDKKHQLPDDILDEEKFPEFHKEVFGAYEGAINSLNMEGNFSLPPPFVDPIALAVKLNPPITGSIKFNFANLPSINPVSLALMLEITPLDLMSKLSLPPNDPDAIIKPPLPNFSLPAYVPDPAYLKEIANINSLIAAPGFPKPFVDKIEYDLWKSPQFGIPKAFGEVLKQLLQDPAKILGMVAPEPNLDFAIEAVQKSGIFGKSDEGENTKSAIQQDLAKYVGQATGVVALGMTIGDGGVPGATGLCSNKIKLKVTNVEAEVVEFAVPDVAGLKMIQVAKAFLSSPAGLSTPGASSVGLSSIGDPGASFPNFILAKGYKKEVPEKTEYGTIATTCGLLTPTMIDVLLGKGWDSANGGEVDITGKPASSKQAPSPIKEAQEAGQQNTPKLDGKGTIIPKGPVGCMIFGKLLRAWVPSGGGRQPSAGDIYFVGSGGSVDHTGVIVGGDTLGSAVTGNIILTADAGQGAAGVPKNTNIAIGDEITVKGKKVKLTAGNTNDADVQEALKKLATGVPADQQHGWFRKSWHPGTNESGSAQMAGNFGEGANQKVKSGKPPRPIPGWISVSKLLKVLGGCVPNGTADPAEQVKFKRWVEDAYTLSWKAGSNSPIYQAGIVFDEKTPEPYYHAFGNPDQARGTYNP